VKQSISGVSVPQWLHVGLTFRKPSTWETQGCHNFQDSREAGAELRHWMN